MRRRTPIPTKPVEYTISASPSTHARPIAPGPRSAAAVLDLQRTAGNRATASLLAAASLQTTPAVVQRVKLKGGQTARYLKKFQTWIGTEADKLDASDRAHFDEVVEWCKSTIQLDEVFNGLDSPQWTTLASVMTGEQAYEFPSIKDAYAEATAGARQSGKAVDQYANVKKKILAEGLKPADFSQSDFASLEIAGPKDGWSSAIQSIWQQITLRTQNAQLSAERTARYSTAKVAGDQIFTAGLIQQVWLVAHGAATAGSGSPNTTVSGTHLDATILPAVAAWRQHHQTTLGAGQGTVSNFHVPGGGTPIEDKSTRAVNADPTRGRQADFISEWGNTSINVHVDANPQH